MMKTVFLYAVQGAMLLTALWASAQVKTTDFLIDSSKDYVYLKFDHLGRRERLGGDEVSKGLWIRLVNNCRVPVIVATFDPGTGDPGSGIYDEVVPAAAKGPILHSEGGQKKPLRSSRLTSAKMPKGYSLPDTFSTASISPGESILFSVPANHVSPSWSLEIRFYLGPPGSLFGSGPYSVLSFDWVDIPEQFRAAWKVDGHSVGVPTDAQKPVDAPSQH
jgi:hypothetical protein